MARPSKLTPAQWAEVERRAAAGEGARKLAKEFGIDEAAIRRRVSPQTPQVRSVAAKLAEAQTELATLPLRQQHLAVSLAETLVGISRDYASAAAISTKTGLRMHALANSEAQKVDDADPLSSGSLDALKGIAALTKLGNEALVPASNLLAANKETVQKLNSPQETEQQAPVRERLGLADWKKAHGIA